MSLIDIVNEKHNLVVELHCELGKKLLTIGGLGNHKTYANIKKQIAILHDIRQLIDKKNVAEIALNEAQILMHAEELKKFN